jgi:hypothetical protein
MMSKIYKKLILGAVAILGCSQAMAIVVNATNDGGVLAGNIAGSGVTIDAGSINYVGGLTSSATFTGGAASGIGIESGILLTSGNANLAVGPNSSSGSTGNNGLPGDADLTSLISGISLDATFLEFEFTTTTGDLFFNFVFASEEYNEYLQFIDPFGLFVDGVNYALAPDGQPISVGTINCGSSGAGTGPNCDYFNNNANADLNTYDIEYDGFSDVFTAEILGLGAGTHTMKFAISDANDHILDSAVFIQAGSFGGTDPDEPPTDVPEPGILALLGLGLAGMTIVRRRKQV